MLYVCWFRKALNGTEQKSNVHVSQKNNVGGSAYVMDYWQLKQWYDRIVDLFLNLIILNLLPYHLLLELAVRGEKEREGMICRTPFTDPLLVTALSEEEKRGMVGRTSPPLWDPWLVWPDPLLGLKSGEPWLPLLVMAFCSEPGRGIRSNPWIPAISISEKRH